MKPPTDTTDQLLSAAQGLLLDLADLIAAQPLLRWALASMALVIIGGWVRQLVPFLGSFLRFLGNIGLMASLLGAVFTVIPPAQLGITLPDSIAALLPGGEAEPQIVEGNTTRIPLSPDGHFWARAKVNDVPLRFLIDTGATLTTLSPADADKADVHPQPGRRRVELKTANGLAQGAMAQIDQLRVGNIAARHLDAVVAPGLGDTSVLGMNFLTRLKSWRVEGKVMVLEPNHPISVKNEKRAP